MAETKTTLGAVISADGTEIGYTRFGDIGSPVVVCHGAFTIAKDWAPFARELSKSNTVYVYDRRGRGRSLDAGHAYSLVAEIDDLAAMVALAGPEAVILGHSFGGGCALAYALRDGFAGRLILYEPAHSIRSKISGGHLPELEGLLARNESAQATEFAMEHIVRMPRAGIEMFKQTPIWPAMVALTRLFPRELRFLETLAWSAEEMEGLRARTWVLLGTLTTPEPNETSTVAALVDRIRGLTLYPIFGQGHVAYLLDPALLSKVAVRCLADE
jgi:pimeloyl-ACP methyl ester carboxylesterase